MMQYRVPQRLCGVLFGATEKHISKLQGSKTTSSDTGEGEITTAESRWVINSLTELMVTSQTLSLRWKEILATRIGALAYGQK